VRNRPNSLISVSGFINSKKFETLGKLQLYGISTFRIKIIKLGGGMVDGIV
jgi:hypothetical protein